MGSWDEYALANDTAADFVCKVLKPIERLANRKKMTEYQYEEVRASIHLIDAMIKINGFYIEIETLTKLYGHLQTVRADEVWKASWFNEDHMKSELGKDLRKIKSAIQRME